LIKTHTFFNTKSKKAIIIDSNLTSGVYLLTVKSDDGIAYRQDNN